MLSVRAAFQCPLSASHLQKNRINPLSSCNSRLERKHWQSWENDACSQNKKKQKTKKKLNPRVWLTLPESWRPFGVQGSNQHCTHYRLATVQHVAASRRRSKTAKQQQRGLGLSSKTIKASRSYLSSGWEVNKENHIWGKLYIMSNCQHVCILVFMSFADTNKMSRQQRECFK